MWSDDDSALPTWREFTFCYILYPSIVQATIPIVLWIISQLRISGKLRCSCRNKLSEKLRLKHARSRELWSVVGFLAQLGCSIISVALWIRRTYTHRRDDLFLDRALSFVFAVEYVRRVCDNNFNPYSVFTTVSFIDVYTIVPVCLPDSYNLWTSLEFLRVYLTLARFHTMARHGVFDFLSEFTTAVLLLLARALCMMICLAGVCFTLEVLGEIDGLDNQIIDTGMGSTSFVQMLYFTITTISTVGYGDYSPSTTASRLFICFEIVVGVVFFTAETKNIMNLKLLLDDGRGSYRARPGGKHVLMIGGGVERPNEVVLALFKELFGAADKVEPGWPDVLIMCNAAEDRILRNCINSMSEDRKSKVFYFIGSPMVKGDLERVCLNSAKMVYVLADVSAGDKSEEDSFNLMRALSVRAFNPRIDIRLMVLRPEFKERAVNSGINREHCFSVDEIKSTLTAHCCRCPGLITVVSNLTDSQHIPDSQWGPIPWMQEYFCGSNNAIYGMVVADQFSGCTWAEFYVHAYKSSGVIVIAAQLDGNVVLNPAASKNDKPLRGGEVAFVLCLSSDQAHMLQKSKTEDWQVAFRARRSSSKSSLMDVETDPIRSWSVQDTLRGIDENGGSPRRSLNDIAEGMICVASSREASSLGPLKMLDVARNSVATFGRAQSCGSTVSDAFADMVLMSRSECQEAIRQVIWRRGGHIVILCIGSKVLWNELALFLDTLRSPHRPWEQQPVMVLSTETPPADMQEKYIDVGFAEGSALSVRDLHSINVKHADVIVTLAGDADPQVLAELRDHNMIAMANTLDFLLCKEETFVMYDFHVESSAKFLPSFFDRDASYPLSSQPTSSFKRTSSSATHIAVDDLASEALKCEVQFMSGQVFTLSFLGEMLGREFYVPSTMELLQALIMPARRGQTSFPFLVSVPPAFEGQTFTQLFEAWAQAKDPAIPFSLYRHFPASRIRYGYTVTNPSRDCVLRADDRVFVLASSAWGRRMQNVDVSPTGVPSWRALLAKENSPRCSVDHGSSSELPFQRASVAWTEETSEEGKAFIPKTDESCADQKYDDDVMAKLEKLEARMSKTEDSVRQQFEEITRKLDALTALAASADVQRSKFVS
eukprot:TRINITY_DN26773_c0_g1_i1.p1 TRINITY_DN26773_c0_g1~~TRINITY_DN26773_c0_g1_i1.p1  ORF type:complete len:1110 (-),score=83.92 TRINITY_DN26773_c0_g1_i1:167-3496(-)